MLGTKYDPASIAQYTKFDLNANFQGKQFAPDKGVSTNCDIHITDDHVCDGGRIITTGAVLGDTVDIKIVDIDNILGYGANVTLKQVVTAWPIYPGSNIWDFSVSYPAKIYGGLYCRIVYNSVAIETDPSPKLLAGYRLHKILW